MNRPGTHISINPPEQGLMATELAQIMKGSNWPPDWPSYKHMAIVSGLPFSCRLLLDRPIDGSVPLPSAMTPEEMAHELLCKFSSEARFPPQPETRPEHLKQSFEVSEIRIRGNPAALVKASWYTFP